VYVMKEHIQTVIESVCRDLFHIEADVELTRPTAKFGDYSTNVALQLAKQLDKPASEVSDMIAVIINNQDNEIIEKAVTAGQGFLNITLTSKALYKSFLDADKWAKPNLDKLILVEFGNPNPFKEMHLGHLYSAIEGDAIADLLSVSGADVKRLSYHGDVGLQAARWVWGVGESIDWDVSKLEQAIKDMDLGFYYAKGAQADESSEEAATKIREINENIYKKDDELINHIYEVGKKISFDKFNDIFNQVRVKNDKTLVQFLKKVMVQLFLRARKSDYIPGYLLIQKGCLPTRQKILD
jgi:arginyl-tRNA synthetase